MSKETFSEWMSSQIRMIGEELIRRADQMNFDGWDMMRHISLEIEIPTYTDEMLAPEINFHFSAYNKTAIDHVVSLGGSYTNVRKEACDES